MGGGGNPWSSVILFSGTLNLTFGVLVGVGASENVSLPLLRGHFGAFWAHRRRQGCWLRRSKGNEQGPEASRLV